MDYEGGMLVCKYKNSNSIHTYIDVSIMTQIIKRLGEGIAATDGAGRSEKARVICTVRFG